EYKYLLLLEFYEDFWGRVEKIRAMIGVNPTLNEDGAFGYEKVPDLKLLRDETEKLVNDLGMPVFLFGAIESLIQWNTILYTVEPILVFGIQHQLNRRALYNDQLVPSQTTKNDHTELGKMIRNNWYESNKRVLGKSISPAYPVIQIQKKLTKRQLKMAIDEEWQSIQETMEDYEKSVPFLIDTKRVSIREIENNSLIYQYRQQGLQHPEIYKRLSSEHKVTYSGGEAEMRRKYSKFCQLLKRIGFMTENM
ncbi:MAG: hypothetical protein ACREHC_00830, partial [Candidatus Levyibacteriota bacterium]